MFTLAILMYCHFNCVTISIPIVNLSRISFDSSLRNLKFTAELIEIRSILSFAVYDRLFDAINRR